MTNTNKTLEQDVLGLLKDETPNTSSMRDFFAESACEILDDGINPMEHYEAALHVFDRWYRNLDRKHSKEAHNED